MNYREFIESKLQKQADSGFVPDNLPDWLYDFQKNIVEWSLRIGRSAIFADCGLGKTAMQLAWANEIVKKTNKPVLILTPLAVSRQTVAEASKFGVESARSSDGKHAGGIVVTNYERLHHFDPSEFAGCVCDESSILKSYSGSIRNAIIEFMRPINYRLLCSATPSPNDYTELGNSVEALGIMRRVEMLATYFVHDGGNTASWRLKGHADNPFWRFVANWARAIRKPSDIGFDDDKFTLPPLNMQDHVLSSKARRGMLFPTEATTLESQREERKMTMGIRCETVADIANSGKGAFVAWCSLNSESILLSRLIDDCCEITGSQTDEEKEEKIIAFQSGQIKRIVTKPTMAAFGLNWQHCNKMSFFPSHSHEQFYQAVRRCWRFGQRNPVTVNIVTTEAESAVLGNLRRKETQAQEMFKMIVDNMKSFYSKDSSSYITGKAMEVPSWLN